MWQEDLVWSKWSLHCIGNYNEITVVTECFFALLYSFWFRVLNPFKLFTWTFRYSVLELLVGKAHTVHHLITSVYHGTYLWSPHQTTLHLAPATSLVKKKLDLLYFSRLVQQGLYFIYLIQLNYYIFHS